MTDYTEKPEESNKEDLAASAEDALPIYSELIVEPVELPAEVEVVVDEAEILVVDDAPVPAPAPPARKKHADPIKVEIEDAENSLPTPSGPAVVGLGETDIVKVSSIVYRNEAARKSLSVHHLQRRLGELGYEDARKDKDGYFGPLTRRAVALFQEQNKLEPNGEVSLVTLKKLFKDDPNVDVQP